MFRDNKINNVTIFESLEGVGRGPAMSYSTEGDKVGTVINMIAQMPPVCSQTSLKIRKPRLKTIKSK